MAAFPVSLLSFSALLLLTIGWLLHCDRCFADSPDIRNAPLDVVAMEYPPYTSAHMPGEGLTFIALRKQLQHSGWRINPVFLPPARAVRQLFNDRDWLISIYPRIVKPAILTSSRYRGLVLPTVYSAVVRRQTFAGNHSKTSVAIA